MIILAVVFLFCGATVAVVQHQYQVSKRLYQAASETFTAPSGTDTGGDGDDAMYQEKKKVPVGELAPIKVDFKGLQKVNTDVVGWIYCPDTVIDYPVLHGATNDTYLHHSYDGTYNASGSIFVDERNNRGFTDPVSILYGHHMASGRMFAILDYWQQQSFFQAHPVMWLLTPTQDYRVDLYSCYDTSAYSDTYYLPFYLEDVADYLGRVESYSAIHTGMQLDVNSRYIVMSTCAYVFEDARSVLHGKLVPLASAGGEPLYWRDATEEEEKELEEQENENMEDDAIEAEVIRGAAAA